MRTVIIGGSGLIGSKLVGASAPLMPSQEPAICVADLRPALDSAQAAVRYERLGAIELGPYQTLDEPSARYSSGAQARWIGAASFRRQGGAEDRGGDEAGAGVPVTSKMHATASSAVMMLASK